MTTAAVAPDDLTEDRFLGGRLTLLQPRRGHRVGGDAALLAAAARSRLETGARAADFGAGVGAVGLALARFGAGSVALVEIDPALAALAERNASRNALSERVASIAADVASLGLARGPHAPACGSCDLIAANPPFDDAGRFRASPDPSKALAHVAADGVIGEWTSAALRLLSPGGSLVMIHRPAALPALLAALAKGFGAIRVKPIHPRADAPASRVLVAARKERGGALALLPPLAMHGADGAFTPEADAAQRGDVPLAMD